MSSFYVSTPFASTHRPFVEQRVGLAVTQVRQDLLARAAGDPYTCVPASMIELGGDSEPLCVVVCRVSDVLELAAKSGAVAKEGK